MKVDCFMLEMIACVSGLMKLINCLYRYLVENRHMWHPEHTVVMKEIEDVNKIKMSLNVNHTKNFQDYEEIIRRRSELVLELKKILEELDIKYRQLSQQVIILNSASSVIDATTLYR